MGAAFFRSEGRAESARGDANGGPSFLRARRRGRANPALPYKGGADGLFAWCRADWRHSVGQLGAAQESQLISERAAWVAISEMGGKLWSRVICH